MRQNVHGLEHATSEEPFFLYADRSEVSPVSVVGRIYQVHKYQEVLSGLGKLPVVAGFCESVHYALHLFRT